MPVLEERMSTKLPDTGNLRILIIGSGAREHAIAAALQRSPSAPAVSCLGSSGNPGIMDISLQTGGDYIIGSITSPKEALAIASETGIGLVIIGPEAPLEMGIADRLRTAGIPVLGPDKAQARIETSKSYARSLMQRIIPEACPAYRVVTDIEAASAFLEELGDNFVVKADGLTGGKGVKVSGDHLNSRQEALAYCRELLEAEKGLEKNTCVIEKRLDGEEFSLMTITDGRTCRHMPPVQDHKRVFNGDQGPNTGGMGSYSDADHSLPFLEKKDLLQARRMNELIIEALGAEHGHPYRGILYGGFMACAQGVKVIEFNARFGDPEALNLLTLLETDAAELFFSAAVGTLDRVPVTFARKASVCKYAVPEGYPEAAVREIEIELGNAAESASIYLGSVDLRGTRLLAGGSRTAAATALGDSIEAAERAAETAVRAISGRLFHRTDIGTLPLIEKRVTHMRRLRGDV
jgi:phosphoribosylamine---glycine ligase